MAEKSKQQVKTQPKAQAGKAQKAGAQVKTQPKKSGHSCSCC
jgi:hypothetical protein